MILENPEKSWNLEDCVLKNQNKFQTPCSQTFWYDPGFLSFLVRNLRFSGL